MCPPQPARTYSIRALFFFPAIYVSSYCYICVLIMLYMCPHTAMYVSSYCYVCVLIQSPHIPPEKSVRAYADVCWRMRTYADVCGRMLTYADVCWRMRTSARARTYRPRSQFARSRRRRVRISRFFVFCCFTAALLLLYCCFTVCPEKSVRALKKATRANLELLCFLLLYCCFTAALLLLYCCFTAALLYVSSY
jgi:hypothetical protein